MITDQNKYNKMYERQNEFEKLIEPIYNDLFKFIISLTKDKDLADDALQNTLIKAYTKLHQLINKEKFKSWVFTIGKFEVLDMQRKHYKRLEVPIEEFLSYISTVACDSVENVIVNKETKEFMICEIKKMKKKYSEIIMLYYYHELTLEEISVTLKINKDTVKTRHMRAKKILDKHFKKNNYPF